MRFKLLLLLCFISCSASAQWWRIQLKKHAVLPYIQPLKDHSISRIQLKIKPSTLAIRPLIFKQSRYSLEATEVTVMNMAKHNMRFRIYNEASYNFSDLAQLYIQLHRLSEAKWYLLQSNKIAREENDDKHTISNLVSLAVIKVTLGDKASAHADLVEARDLAHARAMLPETTEIEKKMQFLEQNGTLYPKPDVKYAEAAETGKKVFR
ncbi:MAG TPA: hypothetical protein VK668_21300 [Mucilaginibacter sp.]|nr:hypothetical protein [Mucilaginibacter sp.]